MPTLKGKEPIKMTNDAESKEKSLETHPTKTFFAFVRPLKAFLCGLGFYDKLKEKLYNGIL